MNACIYTAALDLGASSGRVMLGSFDGAVIKLTEIHRFPNEPVRMNGVLYWDIYRLFYEIKEGLKKIAALGISVASIGVDTWGVDYCLVDKQGNLIGAPVNYRDSRTENAIDSVSRHVPLKEIYDITGIQFMEFNTIFQLYADKLTRPEIVAHADGLLMMPDMFNFLMSGERRNEYTILSTTQLLDARRKCLDKALLDKLSIPAGIFHEMVQPGSIIGRFTHEMAEDTGLEGTAVVAVGCHDTASAVAGTPLSKETAAYLSCGTWSLLGLEVPEPIISEETYAHNFTNEGGVENTIRFLKNINGLWIVQQLLKSHNANSGDSPLGFPDVIRLARGAKRKDFIIDPGDRAFNAPRDMRIAIAEYLKDNNQGEPEGLGELAIAAYNGITNEYRVNVEKIEKLTDKPVDMIHMIGGGIQDEFLMEMSAAATGRTIVAGPVEASVLGNMIMQLKALGKIDGVKQGREIIGRSFEQRVYEP